jgi:hypothetical protein
MLNMRTARTVEWLGMALVLVALLAAAAYVGTVPKPHTSVPAERAAGQVVAPASVPDQPAAHSLYISEQALRRLLDDAYEHHATQSVQRLERILNGRYERRSGKPW